MPRIPANGQARGASVKSTKAMATNNTSVIATHAAGHRPTSKRTRVSPPEPLMRRIVELLDSPRDEEDWKAEIKRLLCQLDGGLEAALNGRTVKRSVALRATIVHRVARVWRERREEVCELYAHDNRYKIFAKRITVALIAMPDIYEDPSLPPLVRYERNASRLERALAMTVSNTLLAVLNDARDANPDTPARLEWHAGLSRLKGEGKRSEGSGIVVDASALQMIACAFERAARRYDV